MNNNDNTIQFYPKENEHVEESIEKILRQTSYTRDEALEKLQLMNHDTMAVIRDFMGIQPKPPGDHSKTSLNQEIYRQIRYKMDESMRGYHERKEKQQQEESKI